MKKSVFAISLVLVTMLLFAQAQPVTTTGSFGNTQTHIPSYAPTDDPIPGDPLLYSQGPGCGLMNRTSEIISQIPLISNSADDFILAADKVITAAKWWFVIQLPYSPITYWTITIYDNAACLPGSVLQQWVIPFNQSHETYFCDFLTTNSYWADLTPSFTAAANTTYWISVQAGDHVYPGQWFWEGVLTTIGCNAAFKSANFGYPEYTPLNGSFSFELYGEDSGIVQTPVSNWALFIGIGLILIFAVIRFRRLV